MSVCRIAQKQSVLRVKGRTVALALACLCFMTAQAQEARYTNSQYGISFQPPAGWAEDKTIGAEALVQYIGPQRADGTRPALNVIVQNAVMALKDDEINAVIKGITEDFNKQRMNGVRVTDYGKTTVAGFDALRVDLTYRMGSEQTRLRQLMVPVAEHKRTYILNLVDNTQYFDESVTVAQGAINSFTANASRTPRADAKTPAGEQAGRSPLLLIILGIISLLVIIGSAYLLLRRRTTL